MHSLRDVVSDAESKKVAVGHFNISDSTQLWGIFHAAKNLNVPVIIGTSEGERDFIGARQAVALVTSIREEYNYPIFINADHHYSLESVKDAIDAGYDAVIFDGSKSKVTRKENIAITKACVEYAHASGRDVLVEGELGNIGQSSKLLEAIPEGAEITKEMMTKPDELKAFVEETGVDLVAPAVGNLHGMLKHGKNPNLSIERILELREYGGVPMVLHGGSGIGDSDFSKAIVAGMCIVHINTEIRKAYRDGIEEALKDNPDEIAPYRFMKRGCDNLEAVVSKRLKLFNNL